MGKLKNGDIKLVKAAMNGNVSVFKMSNLSQYDDHFFRKSCEENNIIHIAVRYEKVGFIETFLREYFNDKNKKLITEKNSRGDTPLHVAAEVDNLGIVKLLYHYMKKTSVEGRQDNDDEEEEEEEKP